ncbi:hypothetical protein [Streptomyces sp. CBMA152]|uniref:hypothetical protein n=1 Tax=Streptomyces sp. CBMA152 TaxID=1896312 RepID=UPI0016608256|nr:hypothetical protein [Streptomyces sp. CBMA152]MBD0744578.1 hypothetical protein [Streptomyces sp. CBMA152]
MGEKPDTGTKQDEKRLDLSVPQVAGSALAAIAAAVLASKLGVYGTILGAGVVSVVATCGGTVFQHLFRRTGEQLRDVTVQTIPKARQTPGLPAYEETRQGEFGAATVHGTRVRGWKRSALGAAVVFVIAMAGITTYELASDSKLSGGKGGTTFGSVVSGSGARSSDKEPETDRDNRHTPGTGTGGGQSPSKDPGQGGGSTSGTSGTSGGSTGTSPTPSPSTSPGTTTGGQGTTGGTPSPPPSPSPSADTGPAAGGTGATGNPGSSAAPPAT